MKVLITGATGLVGKAIGKKLVQRGHQVIAVSRNKEKAFLELPFPCEVVEGDLGKGPLESLPQVDAVIHLMGESVAGSRWNPEKKERIFDSRVLSTKNLGKSLKSKSIPVLSASAVGYYPSSLTEEHKEFNAPGTDFLAYVCQEWEKAVKTISSQATIFRIGVVLAEKGGALDKMLFPFRAGFGGAVGSGRQWMSWVHIEDLSEAFVWALLNRKTGTYNVVAPEPVTNREFSRTLASALRKPLGPPVPKFVLKAMFGEMAEVIVASQKVSSRKLQEEGFTFKYDNLKKALTEICENWAQGEDVYISEQYIPKKISDLFPFFKNANNLESITPPTLNFRILRISTPEMQRGTEIDYKLKIRGIPVTWKTVIEDWVPFKKFVDNQVEGPYKLWHHTHEFEPMGEGTLIRDRVRYKVPMGFLGWASAGHFVEKEVDQIFEFRRKAIYEKFGK